MADDPERPGRNDPPPPVRDPFGAGGAEPPRGDETEEHGEHGKEGSSQGWHPSPPPIPEDLQGRAPEPPPVPGEKTEEHGEDGEKGQDSSPESSNDSESGGPSRNGMFGAWAATALLVALIAGFWFRGGENIPKTEEIAFKPQFTDLLERGFVRDVEIVHDGSEAYAKGKIEVPSSTDARGEELARDLPSGTPFRVNVGGEMGDFERLLDRAGAGWEHKYQDHRLMFVLVNVLPMVLLIGLFWFFFVRQARGPNGPLGFGRSRARRAERTPREKTTFKDVAGCEEAKEEVVEVVEYLKDPKKFGRLGGKMPHGILMAGPPGTGKTLLAKAIAGEAGVPFFSIAGSDFVEMFVGVGASRVRDMFAEAKKNSPCLVFIDEIDAVGRRRGAGIGGGHDEREQTLNALLVEMDGFGTNAGIVVIAATNRPDVLDPALLRPGRFDRQVVVDLPTMEGRLAILKVHAAKVKLAEGTDLSRIARGTPGCSGADLANIVNEAALIASRADKPGVDEDDFEAARDKVLWGKERRSRAMDEQEKRITAYHEAGHAVVAILEPEADPVHKITIIPRGMALGLTATLPKKDRMHYTRRHLLADLAIDMGGRVAEEIFLPDVSTGARQDLQQATQLAHSMVCDWGLSEKLGPRTFGKNEDLVFLGAEVNRTQDYSEETARLIDEEVTGLLRAAHARAKELIESHRGAMEALVAMLLEKETVDGPDAEDIVKLGRVRTPAERGETPPPAPPPVPEAAPAPPSAETR
jgi:cell division protease FtsH